MADSGSIRFVDLGTLGSQSDIDVVMGWGVQAKGSRHVSSIGSALAKAGMK
jgi:hypothetical protein